MKGVSAAFGFLAVKFYPFSFWPARTKWLILFQMFLPALAFGCVALSVPLILHRLVGRRKTRLPAWMPLRKCVGRLASVAFVFAASTMTVFSIAAIGLTADYVAGISRAPYEDLFNRQCGSCHGPERPLGYVKSPLGWKQTIERMARKDPGRITRDDQRKIYVYLLEIRSYSGRDLYRGKCLACHLGDALLGKGGDPVSWDGLLSRLHRQNPFALSIEETEMILEFITKKRSKTTDHPPFGSKEFALWFEKKCGLCHDLKRSTGKRMSEREWQAFLIQHRIKSPAFLDEGFGSREFARFMKSLNDLDSGAFARHFPHDGF